MNMVAVEAVTALDRLVRGEKRELGQPKLDNLLEDVRKQMLTAVNALVDQAA